MFADTDCVPARDSRAEGRRAARMKNVVESRLVAILVRTLIDSGIDASTIGIISPYVVTNYNNFFLKKKTKVDRCKINVFFVNL